MNGYWITSVSAPIYGFEPDPQALAFPGSELNLRKSEKAGQNDSFAPEYYVLWNFPFLLL